MVVDGEGVDTVAHAGAVLLQEAARAAGLDRGLSAALSPWRRSGAVHDPGKIVLDLAVSPADVNHLRAAPAVFGLVASDPTVSRLVGVAAGRRARPRRGGRCQAAAGR